MKPYLLIVAASAVSLVCGVANADSYHVGSLDGQNGWNGGATVVFVNNNAGDEAVTTDAAHTGTQSWRYSSGYNSPGAGTPFSPQLAASAGLSNSVPTPTADTMSISLWFKPVGALGDGSSQSIYEGSTPRDQRAGGNLYLTNTAAGIELGTYEYGGGSFPFTTLATLNDTNWHEVTITTTSSGNDPNAETTMFSIDGGAAITTTPWIDQSKAPGPYPSSASVKFATADAGPSSTLGFYYDDLSYSVYNSAAPNTILGSYSTSFEAVTAVPLPKSAWAGLALMCGLGLVRGAKRMRPQSA